MNKIGWFLVGNASMGIFVLLTMSYLNIGNPKLTFIGFITAIMIIGFSIVGYRDKPKKELKLNKLKGGQE